MDLAKLMQQAMNTSYIFRVQHNPEKGNHFVTRTQLVKGASPIDTSGSLPTMKEVNDLLFKDVAPFDLFFFGDKLFCGMVRAVNPIN